MDCIIEERFYFFLSKTQFTISIFAFLKLKKKKISKDSNHMLCYWGKILTSFNPRHNLRFSSLLF